MRAIEELFKSLLRIYEFLVIKPIVYIFKIAYSIVLELLNRFIVYMIIGVIIAVITKQF
jgi:hypothetical protein